MVEKLGHLKKRHSVKIWLRRFSLLSSMIRDTSIARVSRKTKKIIPGDADMKSGHYIENPLALLNAHPQTPSEVILWDLWDPHPIQPSNDPTTIHTVFPNTCQPKTNLHEHKLESISHGCLLPGVGGTGRQPLNYVLHAKSAWETRREMPPKVYKHRNQRYRIIKGEKLLRTGRRGGSWNQEQPKTWETGWQPRERRHAWDTRRL